MAGTYQLCNLESTESTLCWKCLRGNIRKTAVTIYISRHESSIMTLCTSCWLEDKKWSQALLKSILLFWVSRWRQLINYVMTTPIVPRHHARPAVASHHANVLVLTVWLPRPLQKIGTFSCRYIVPVEFFFLQLQEAGRAARYRIMAKSPASNIRPG